MSEQNKINDGGPAFPTDIDNSREDRAIQTGNNTWRCPGISKREYLAAAALTGLMANPVWLDKMERSIGNYALACAAETAFEQADAMLATSGEGEK